MSATQKDLALVKAFERVPGLKVHSLPLQVSESGTFSVWFEVDSPSALMVVTRAIDNRYGGPPRDKPWKIEVYCQDIQPGYAYCLHGSTENGWDDKIAKNIEGTLQDDAVMRHFNVGAVDCLKVWGERKGLRCS
jgi:hypothetical protein